MVELNVYPTSLAVSELPTVGGCGLQPSELFELRALTIDEEGLEWSAHISALASGDGTFDLAKLDAIEGTYTGIDPAGVFWSMRPSLDQDLDHFRLAAGAMTKRGPSLHPIGYPTHFGDEPLVTRISILRDGIYAAEEVIERHRIPQDVTEERVTGSLTGSFFCRRGEPDAPAVLFISGSEGGVKRYQAAQLAMHGFSVLALGYFGCQGRPATLTEIAIEYFEEGIDWLLERTQKDSVALVGGSRGGEGVLVIGAHSKRSISAIASLVPADIYCATDLFDGTRSAAWTYRGKVLPAAGLEKDYGKVIRQKHRRGAIIDTYEELFPYFFDESVYAETAIPIERIAAPILFITGKQDRCWPSHHATLRAINRLKENRFGYPIEHSFHEDAGHLVGFPGLPTVMSEKMLMPGENFFLALGGTPAANAANQRKSWADLIQFLKEHNK